MANNELKVYELLPHMNPTAPIYTQVSKNQQVRHNRRPSWTPHLQYTVADKDGNNVTLRLKLNSNSINQDDQIKNGIPANAKFTPAERLAPRFYNGVCMTSRPVVQKFLENIPEYEEFEGISDVRPKYKLLDKVAETKNENDVIRKQVKAASKVLAIDEIDEARNLALSILGSSYTLPEDLLGIQNVLIDFINETDLGADKVLEDHDSSDDQVKVLVGRALSAGILSFSELPNQVAVKRNGKWIGVKDMSSTYTLEERESRFQEFLTLTEGKSLRLDLEADVKKEQGTKPINNKQTNKKK